MLSIQSRPVFTISIGDMHVDEKDDLTWTCEAFGIPDVKYEWMKNGWVKFLVQNFTARWQSTQNCIFCTPYTQLLISDYIQFLNKPFVNRVTLREQNLSLKYS